MDENRRNNGAKTVNGRRPGAFQPGNPGRPKGARNKVTRAAEALLDGEAEALTRKAIELALEGDTIALRLCLERILPPRKERPVTVELPRVENPSDALAASAALLAAVANGVLAPGEAHEIARLLAIHLEAVEMHELAARITALEEKTR